jgi:Fungal Zn(2)-Cys(6) binuclear cluster domain
MAGQLSEVSTPSNSSSTDLSNVYYDALFPDHHRASWDANAMNMAVKRHRPYSPRKQSSASEDADSSRPKVYVLKACVSCKASHVACDIARPCQRCVRLNKGDTCVDAERKKRGRPCNSGKRQKEAAEKKRREREREMERLDECNHTGVPSVLMGRRDEVYSNQTPASNSYPNLQEQQDQDDILQMLSYVGM